MARVEIYFLILLGGAAILYRIKSREQRRRIALLGSYLGKYQIEKLMQHLTEGYLRALGEGDAQRQDQIWSLLETTEVELSAQVKRLAADFSRVEATQALVSRLPLAVAFADQLFPRSAFDMRKLLAIHARGISDVARDGADQSPKSIAYVRMAEMLLLQHSCHWFCRSKAVASARMLARHQTSYAQLVQSVSVATRQAYRALTGI